MTKAETKTVMHEVSTDMKRHKDGYKIMQYIKMQAP